ncbi:ankyrin repeat and LEM domain-containing protein 1-like [Cydia amplana]|uniref:ankyrin repeat and LEM domain-containing protein 1-like n=1 Tax=Cydia amplana TaxID=1869771 RepID=UPI002FE6BCB3
MGSSYREVFKLYDLIQSGDSRSVESFLSENRIHINVILPCKGIGVLHLAVGIEPLEKSKECTEVLLKHGGDPNLCTDDGVTPVHIAAIWGRVQNLKLLLGCGGDPSRLDLDGHSAFAYAAREEQWEVYDYLHNVVDQLDDTFGSPCAYTLDLDKVLMTTDQVVAEYEPVTTNPLHHVSTCRRSEMVRDWCEKTSLVMNNLYPTILGEPLLEDESAPWNTDLTKNTFDLTKDKTNDTRTSYKTCTSRPVEIEISGVQRLEDTVEEKSCSCQDVKDYKKQRMSVYENFSLPGSPNSITHVNYKTKTSLKKCKSQLSSDMRRLTLDDSHSLLTEDNSQMDKALIVVQNKTNEWLSNHNDTDVGAMNTRRSSASSGVSSNFSGGSIVIANVQEEYKYQDEEEDVVLIEKRLLVSPVVLPVDEAADTTADQTIVSVASSLPASVVYDSNTLRAELVKLGFKPGPIQDGTKTLYLKKLQALKKQPIVFNKQGKTYSIELEKSLRTSDWMNNLSPYIELETKARTDFTNSNKKWREGTAKTSFTYLLLDPRLTQNLPAKAGSQSHHISWVTFVNSIFYVGKGKRSRPYSHLYQALTLWKRDFTTSKDKKVQYILDIWSDKVGVVCLHIFQNVIPAEAYTYEAAMIDVLGLPNLKNLKSGNYYGVAASWPLKDRRMLGLYLLYKAMLIFLNEGERQLRPDDID